MMVIVSKKYGTNDVSKIIQHIKEDEEESEVN